MRGHLVLADISGYTRFLNDSELEHANGIISDLLNAVIGVIEAPLKVSGIEGDAVFMYGELLEDMNGQTVVESVELLYFSFSKALETMVLNTTCQCNACVNINTLGMKIVMHCGEFARSEIGGVETISGPDVIVAHRLLKNEIVETTGIADYMLITQQCVDALEVESIVSGWIPHTEKYEHVGEVAGYVSSLKDIWEFVRNQNENKVLEKEAWLSIAAFSKAPPAMVWEHLVDPIKRTEWLAANGNEIVGETNGRIAPGTEYHCAHGEHNDIAVFTVLDMRPNKYMTIVVPLPNGTSMRYTDYVIPAGTGTRIVTYAAPLYSTETGEPLPPEDLADREQFHTTDYQKNIDRLAAIADEAATNLTLA